jgi:hypothetical protein
MKSQKGEAVLEKNLDAMKFYSELEKLLAGENSGETIERYNRYYNAKGKEKAKIWTMYLTAKVMDIFHSLKTTPGCAYYGMDVIGWTQRKKELKWGKKDRLVNPHLWDLDVAVEFENSPQNWTDKLVKLFYLRCPLKVVISYRDCKKKDSGEKALACAAQIVNKLREPNPIQEDEQLLVVLGNSRSGANYKSWEDIGFAAYVFDANEGEFKLLEEQPATV